jgi:nucleoside-diphosphate-sugar epimerase
MHPNFQFVKQDICKWDGLPHAVDLVYQFASPASPLRYMSMPINTYLVNSIGTYNMLEYAKKYEARFVFASSSEIYGEAQVHPQPETYYGHVNSVGKRSCYDEGKRFGEGMTILYHREFDMDARVARIFNVYGSRMRIDDCRVIPNFITQCLQSKPITVYGDGKQTRSFCYIDDFLEAIIALGFLDGLSGSIINIGNPDEIRIFDLMLYIKRLCNSQSPIQYYPLPSNDPIQRKPNIDRARELLNWEPKTKLEEGLIHCINYYMSII